MSEILNSIVVMIDQFTKATVETITYDVLSKHCNMITDIRELGEHHYKSSLVIFEPSFSVCVTPEMLEEFKSKYELTVYAVYQNDEAVQPLLDYVTPVKADYSEIGWNFVYAVVHSDLAILEPYQKSLKVLSGFKAIRDKIPEDVVEYIDRLRGTYLTMVSATRNLLSDNASLRETVNAQEVIGRQLVESVKELNDLLEDAQDRINSYELTLSKSYSQTHAGFYPERPRVLYIKQHSHLSGIDNLLSILYVVLTKQYMSSCKVVKLVDSSNALALRYVPNNYEQITDSYNTAQVLTNDFIMKMGGYNIMFDTLLLNRSGLNYLIVHDMRGVQGTALDPTLIDLRVNEMSSDFALLGEYDNVLSDLKKQSDFIWDFDDTRKFTGSNSVKLMNHPTVQSLLERIM